MQNQIARQLPRYFGWMLVALLAFAGQARAASYVGEWDPAFGSDFPDLGWRGKAVFEIPDACLANDGVYVNNNLFNSNPSDCADGGGLRIISAAVQFYNLNDPNTVLDTLNFTEPSLPFSMEVTGGELSGVIGVFLTADVSSINLVTSQGYQGASATFGLGFVESPLFSGDYYAQMGWAQYRTCNWYSLSYTCKQFGLSELIRDPNSGPFLRFTQLGLEVPEPGSLALFLPAIGMLAALRRRKHSPAAGPH